MSSTDMTVLEKVFMKRVAANTWLSVIAVIVALFTFISTMGYLDIQDLDHKVAKLDHKSAYQEGYVNSKLDHIDNSIKDLKVAIDKIYVKIEGENKSDGKP